MDFEELEIIPSKTSNRTNCAPDSVLVSCIDINTPTVNTYYLRIIVGAQAATFANWAGKTIPLTLLFGAANGKSVLRLEYKKDALLIAKRDKLGRYTFNLNRSTVSGLLAHGFNPTAIKADTTTFPNAVTLILPPELLEMSDD